MERTLEVVFNLGSLSLHRWNVYDWKMEIFFVICNMKKNIYSFCIYKMLK